MINVTFVYNSEINGRPSWIGYDGAAQFTILWNGTYWLMYGWPYNGEPRNYTDTLDPQLQLQHQYRQRQHLQIQSLVIIFLPLFLVLTYLKHMVIHQTLVITV